MPSSRKTSCVCGVIIHQARNINYIKLHFIKFHRTYLVSPGKTKHKQWINAKNTCEYSIKTFFKK